MSSQEPRLVLLGRQGAGKGTQSTRLAEHFGVIHVSTGDMFRTQAAQGTAFGLEAKRYMDSGDLVPDEIVVGVIEESMVPGGPLGDGFVLDGFPRTKPQAEQFEQILDGRPLDIVITLDVPLEIVLDRISGRRVCVSCQRVYHVNMPPTTPWVCDTCGGAVVQRDDDTEEAVERRLEAYETDTVPILDYYREIGKRVKVVDGVGAGDLVFERIINAIDGVYEPR